MRLVELELTNIKSYHHETIKFSEGINCILGLNGCGKSTIIESIGSVLFNYNRRTNSNLLRYNETKGNISLLFEGNDNKYYKIVKTLRNKGVATVKIIDFENNQVLQESVSNVYEFVKKVLNIPKEKSLSKMFEEIIAVPQGTFVNAFLETSSKMKENFDKLFELDIYKSLADKMKILFDQVQNDYIVQIEKKISELNGKLSNFDDINIEIKQLDDKVNISNNLIKQSKEILKNKINEKNNLDSKIKEIDNNNNIKNTLETQINSFKEQLHLSEENLENASKANQILKEHQFSYNLYLLNNQELARNEEIYDKYISLKDKIIENENIIKTCKAENDILFKTIHDLKYKRGELKETIINKNQEIDIKKQENTVLESEIKPLKEKIILLNKNQTNKLSIYRYNLDKLNTYYQYLLSYNNTEYDYDFDEKILRINSQLDVINENKETIINLGQEKAKITSNISNLKINSNYIKDGQCPILKQKCLNIRGSNLDEEVNKMICENEKELLEINTKINNLIIQNQTEEHLINEKQMILLQKTNLEKETEAYNNYLAEINLQFKEDINELKEENIINVVIKLIKKYQNLLDNDQNEELIKLNDEENTKSNKIYSNYQNIKLIENLINEKNKELEKIIKEISETEDKYNKNIFEVEKKQKENKIYEDTIFQYNDIKKLIENNKAVLLKHKDSYEIYLQNQSIASNTSKYQRLVNELKEKIELKEKNKREVEFILYDLEKRYSKEQYDILLKDIENINLDISKLQTTLEFSQERITILNNNLDKLNQLIKEKNTYQNKLIEYQELYNKFRLIREIFTKIPRELSEQIREYIGNYASSIYRKISSENVRIQLLDDYEVIIIDCTDESKQKTLSQLSGGEQMSVAISIRLAMLKQTTSVEFYFMDEPTINLDYERRMMIAEVVKDISKELKQLFVISHDDTFDSITDNIIKLEKHNNISLLDN